MKLEILTLCLVISFASVYSQDINVEELIKDVFGSPDSNGEQSSTSTLRTTSAEGNTLGATTLGATTLGATILGATTLRSTTLEGITLDATTSTETSASNSSSQYASNETTPENDQCECVPYYLCRNGTIITNGDAELILDTRNNVICENYLHTCCYLSQVNKEPIIPSSNEPMISPPKEPMISSPKEPITSSPKETLKPPQEKDEDSLECGWHNPGVDFPWVVEVLRQEVLTEAYSVYPKISYVYQCYGALVHQKVVITAAHCVEKFKGQTLMVRAGVWGTKMAKESRLGRSYGYQEQVDPYQVTNIPYQVTGISYQVTNIAHRVTNNPYQVSRSLDQVSSSPDQVSSSPDQEQNNPYQVANNPYQVPNNPYQVPNNPYQVPNNPYQVPNNPYQVPNNPYQVPNNPYQVPNNPYQVPNNPYQVPNTDISSHQDVFVTSLSLHPEFCPRSLYNDIAILFLENPLATTNNVKTICLPPPRTIFDNTRCFVVGTRGDFGQSGLHPVKRHYEATGHYETTGHYDIQALVEAGRQEAGRHEAGRHEAKAHDDPKGRDLQAFNVPTVDTNTCQNELRKTQLGDYFALHETFMCAGGEVGNDITMGDGGSPLVCPIPGKSERFQLAGLVSWGIGSLDGIPKVYVDVSQFRDWIDEQIACNVI